MLGVRSEMRREAIIHIIKSSYIEICLMFSGHSGFFGRYQTEAASAAIVESADGSLDIPMKNFIHPCWCLGQERAVSCIQPLCDS
jgi:hypothetical protein